MYRLILKLILICCGNGLIFVNSANILGIFPSFGKSQFMLGGTLMGELAKRGHNVTVVSAFLPEEDIQNYNTILVEMKQKYDETDFLATKSYNSFEKSKQLFDDWTHISENLLSQPQIYDLIHSNSTFDVVIYENFGNEAQMGFAQHFNAPLVVFSSQGLNDWSSSFVGNVRLPSITPYSVSLNTNRMTFFQRLTNTLVNIYDIIYKQFVYYPQQQKIMSKYFGEQMNLQNVMTNVSFLLVNSHPLTTEPSLLTSAVVEIGGFHITSKQLPDDIRNFMDEAENGVVLFSLGSNVNYNNFSKQIVLDFIKAIEKLPQRFIWKCEVEGLTDLPKNLLIRDWLPQSAILAHPKTVAFVTHCGLLSITEAIHYGVPIVAVPLFGEQDVNTLRAVEKGIAVHVDVTEINAHTFKAAINEVTSNLRYKENAKLLSKMFRDRPVDPLDLAVHTIEYTIKYKPAKYYRSSALDLYWFQLYLLDICLFIIVIYKLLKKIVKRDTRNKKIKVP